MQTSFMIFIRAIAIYAAVTLPALALPPMYIISLLYTVFYGWFAWALFMVCCLLVTRYSNSFQVRMLLLTIAVPLSVAFAFQMIEVFDSWDDVWHSGELMLFPAAATIAGWISLFMAEEKFRVKENTTDATNEIVIYEKE